LTWAGRFVRSKSGFGVKTVLTQRGHWTRNRRRIKPNLVWAALASGSRGLAGPRLKILDVLVDGAFQSIEENYESTIGSISEPPYGCAPFFKRSLQQAACGHRSRRQSYFRCVLWGRCHGHGIRDGL